MALEPMMMLEPFEPLLEAAAEPFVQPVLAGAVKVLPRWAEEDGVTKWRLKYRAADTGEDLSGRPGSVDDGRTWVELQSHSFTRELQVGGLQDGTLHFFKAALQTPQGWSDWSTIVGCVPPSPTLPGKCAAVFALVDDMELALVRWTKPIDYAASKTGGGIRQYMIRVTWPVPGHPLGEQDLAGERFVPVSEDVDSYKVSGLKSLTEYRFQVAAQNSTGWGEYSDVSGVLMMPPPVPPQLNQPTLRRATHHTVVIQWQHPSTSSVPLDSFRFRWTTVPEQVKSKSLGTSEDWSGVTPVQELHDVPTNSSQYVVEGLEPGRTLVFQVRALNEYGMGVWSDSSIPVKTLDGSRPSKIVDLEVPDVYRSFITLQWTPAEENGYSVVEHRLKYSTSEDMNGADEIVSKVERKNGRDTCDLRHLSKARYFFQVAAVNQVGMSDWSDAASVDLMVVARLEDA